ncbi:fungal-specific transcription factor domain-containing protein [Aspergillus crustosus]
MTTPTFIVSMPSTGPESHSRKRTQVARACNWCRVHRLKCDSEYPCGNCRKKGGQCNNDRLNKSVTLPQAYREIERLKKRMEELEGELHTERKDRTSIRRLVTPSPEHSPGDSAPAVDLGDSSNNKVWDGIHISTTRSPNKTWYGVSSIFFFIGRINTFLTAALKQAHSARGMVPDSASTMLDAGATLDGDQAGRAVAPADDPSRSLSSMQEEYFLHHFWESFYPAYPILDEGDFKEHYQSLWADSDKERKPSPLVDIVLALCMQFGMAHQPGGRGLAATNDRDPTVAGRWHYRRCLTLLSSELESPTMSTLQCHLLCSIYLCCAGFLNMSENACALAVRTAYMLGLHVEPSPSLPRRERELRKRVWWCLFTLESNRSMKLGRPFTIQETTSSCTLPADDREIAALSGSSFAPIGGNVTWLTWNLHKVQLVLAARKAHVAVYGRAIDASAVGDASLVAKFMEGWLRNVPEVLKTSRQGNGIPFSTDRSPLQIEQFTPAWLQRERLLLELLYHNLCLSLYRSAVCFTLYGVPGNITEPAAMRCAAHAMALIHIMHQVMQTTTILTGWHEAFQWEWNAAMTLVGFVLAFPNSSSTWPARNSIDLSVSAFEKFGNCFAVANGAATIMRDLGGKIDRLAREGIQTGAQHPITPDSSHALTPVGNSGYESLLNHGANSQGTEWFNFGEEPMVGEIGGILGHSIDVSAEILADLDWSNLNNTFFDQWAF